ncbi:MAG: SUF system Fe-S cluster assembly protein [Alphaproteobacteria bacterium]|nr:SUF system Fe-S cluster assembly protein [Alphaproteobacteria bacterium]
MQPYNPYMMAMDDDPAVEEGFTATRGAPLADGAEHATEEDVVKALQSVYDPEIPVNIYDLGLIYEINQKQTGDLHVKMTLTAPACPVAGELPGEVADAVAAVPGVGEVEVEMTWTPPWNPGMMSEDAKIALDMG